MEKLLNPGVALISETLCNIFSKGLLEGGRAKMGTKADTGDKLQTFTADRPVSLGVPHSGVTVSVVRGTGCV